MEQLNDKWKTEVYLHVCNGGVSISVEQDEHGAKLKISTGSYGNCTSTQEIITNNEGIKALSELFNKAAEQDFKINPNYSIAYLPSKEEKTSCGSDGSKEIE